MFFGMAPKNLGFVWFGEWKSGRIENGERIEKWKDGKLFYLVEKKSERIENKICVNLPLYPI